MSLFLSPKQLRHIPEAFRSHALHVKFTVVPYEGASPAAMPYLSPDVKDYVANWDVSHELELEPDPNETEKEIAFEIVSDQSGVVGFGEAFISMNKNGGEFHEIVKIMDNHCGFKGAKLYVEVVQVTMPPHIPKYIRIRVDGGDSFLQSAQQPIEDDTEVYISIQSNDRHVGTTRKVKGAGRRVWMDSFEEEYRGESSAELRGFGVNKFGDNLDFGSARINLWDLLKKPRDEHGEWLKHGEVLLSPEGNHLEKTRGRVKVTIRFWDDFSGQLIKADVEEQPPLLRGTEAPGDPVPLLGGPPEGGDPSAIPPKDLQDAMNQAKEAADQAVTAARAADAAAADADQIARSNHNRDIDDAANTAENAARHARKHADDAVQLAQLVKDEVKQPKPRPHVLQDLADQLGNKVNEVLDDRDRAEDESKHAMKINADDLAAKAKDHYSKCADFANQTAKIADEYPEAPEIRKLADWARNDQSTAMLAAQDARADAKACRDARTVADALSAMRDCEAMVKEAKEAEEEAKQKWKRANKLAQKRKKLLEQEQQEEWKRKQEEAEEEALRRREERRLDHERDKAQRRTKLNSDGEADAYNFAAANRLSVSELAPTRPQQGGIFRNCCWQAPRSNPQVKMIESYPVEEDAPSNYGGHEYLVAPSQMDKNEVTVYRAKAYSGGDASTSAGDSNGGGGMCFPAARKSATTGAFNESYGLLETTRYQNVRQRTPWCWCFGCQFCHCCGEC